MRKLNKAFKSIGVLLVVMFATSDAQVKRNDTSGVGLLETGVFHGNEVTAQTGERWLGLYVEGESSVLLPYRLTVDTVFDDIVDHGTGQKTGKEVTIDLPLEPLFLLNGATMLSAGSIGTVFGDGERTTASSLTPSSPIELKLAGDSYQLEVIGAENGTNCSDQQLARHARLVLKLGEKTQTLYSLEDCGNDPGWALLWAGDLDRDGKLDLYVNVSQHYNVSERRLFLSSRASAGQMVKEIAQFITVGC